MSGLLITCTHERPERAKRGLKPGCRRLIVQRRHGSGRKVTDRGRSLVMHLRTVAPYHHRDNKGAFTVYSAQAVDFLVTTNESFDVPIYLLPNLSARPRARVLLGVALCGAALFASGCDRIKTRMDGQVRSQATSDPVWVSDSTFLSQKPSIVFRLVTLENGRTAVPVATYGASGFRALKMSVRGWKALDVGFLHSGNSMTAVREGRPAGELKMARGQWERGTALDSLPGCPVLVPGGLVEGGSSSALAFVGASPTIASPPQVSPAELAEALDKVPMLIAPAQGISRSMISKYKREVHIIPGGGPRASILVIYNDPEEVSDTLRNVAQRPRQLVLMLDKGIFGFRPSYTYATLGNALSNPRLSYVDFMDVDADGKAEVFFAFQKKFGKIVLFGTEVLRFQNEQWTVVLQDLLRCQS